MIRKIAVCLFVFLNAQVAFALPICIEAYSGKSLKQEEGTRIETPKEREARLARYKSDLTRNQLEAVILADAAKKVGARVIIRRPYISTEAPFTYMAYEGYVTSVEEVGLHGKPDQPTQMAILLSVSQMRIETYNGDGFSVHAPMNLSSTEYRKNTAFLIDEKWPLTVELAPVKKRRRPNSKDLATFKAERMDLVGAMLP